MKILIFFFTCLLIAGCFPRRNALMIRDDDLSPTGARNQLELASARGLVGHGFYPPASEAPLRYYRAMGSGKKSWILVNWGKPDEIIRKNGTEYLVYTKRSKEAPEYVFQKSGYVKLAYRNDNLVSIEGHFSNCPTYMKGPVYLLPK